MNSIPDRWLQYKPYGTVIENTKILAFKVPLKATIKTPPTKEFTIPLLLEAFPKLKFVIDLTNTMRYYDKNEFTAKDVGYLKIMVPGQQVPPESCVLKFFKAVDKFLATAKTDEVIGVHCTHGLNRTGYLVCRYFVQQLGWDADDAVKAFQEARGHPIERQEYINHLKSSMRRKIDTSSISLTPQSTPSAKKSKSSRPSPIENWRDRVPLIPGFLPHMSPMGAQWRREVWGGAPPQLPPPEMGLPPPSGPGFPMPRPNAYRMRPPAHDPGFLGHTGCPPRPVYPGSRPPINRPRPSALPAFRNGFVNGTDHFNTRHGFRRRAGDPRAFPGGEFKKDTRDNNFCGFSGPARRTEQRRLSRFSN
ncbi:RNA/RNP complex-1-interacting phosphatase [Diachasma alloeum]|uniref:RNA/RNP complex-1-interacting phosphatase n=1 Tax=Diachasma alloeum TaxID=454923 RepID=UPI0007381264|nr:RNA/RNP complex-1-interacting phosphatase [Diachasma alloeum]